MNMISCWHDMRFVNTLTWCMMCPYVQIVSTSYCFMCSWYIMLTYLSCTRSCLQILYRGWSYREYMMDIMETWLMSTISSIEPESRASYHGHMIPWHHVSLRSLVTYHVSCVVTTAGLSCVCVCVQHNLRLMLVSLQLFKDTNATWSHFWGPESHTNVRNHESVGDLLLVYRYTCTSSLALGWDTSFRLPWLG